MMKIATAILVILLILFLVPPSGTMRQAVETHSCCASHQTNKTETPNTKDCNPFVNCCYRTFEVSNAITIQEVELVFIKHNLIPCNGSEVSGFYLPCWRPPQLLI